MGIVTLPTTIGTWRIILTKWAIAIMKNTRAATIVNGFMIPPPNVFILSK
jgi:hypothetical protein